MPGGHHGGPRAALPPGGPPGPHGSWAATSPSRIRHSRPFRSRARRQPPYGFPVCGNCLAASSKVRTASNGSLPAAATFRAL